MESLPALLGIAVILFASTNVDDLFVLLGFFADTDFRARHVVVGQFLGIGVLFGLSVLASLLSWVLPRAYIGLIGLAPIFLGFAKLFSLRQSFEGVRDGSIPGDVDAARAGRNVGTVAFAVVANGGDNISAYTPLFASRSALEIAMVGLMFVIMTVIWCALGFWLIRHPALGAPIRRYGRMALPFILIGFGVLVLYESGTLDLLPT